MNQEQQSIDMNQLIDSLMIHCENTEQICRLIRLAAATSGVRYGMNLHDVVPGEEETYEYWRFLFPDSMGETLHLQSVTCLCCGNYLCSTEANGKHAKCLCPDEYDNDEAVKNREIERKLGFALMDDYDAFNEFVGLVLPDGAPDRLCEDVIGEISRFLV
jgi:hypothetical protein